MIGPITKRQVGLGMLIGIALLTLALGVYAITSGVYVSGTVPLNAEDGPRIDVQVSGESELDLTNPFPDSSSVEVVVNSGSVTFSGQDGSTATVQQDDVAGEWTNVSSISATELSIDPGDKQSVTVGDGVTDVAFRDAGYGDNTVDFVYSSSSGSQITITSLPTNTEIVAATTGGEHLDTVTTDGSGTATFSVSSGTDKRVLLVDPVSPTFDEANASPRDDEGMTSREVELSIPMNDSDFGTASGDEITVDFYLDGNVVDSQTHTQNGTITTTVTVSEGGQHSWHVEASDRYGSSTTSSQFSFRIPSVLRVFNESAPDTLVQDATVEIQFYGGDDGDDFTVQRSTSDGTIDMTGLPADREFVVVAQADTYHNRRIYIESLFEQAEVFLIPESETTVYNVFSLNDQSGSYPPGDTRLIIQRGLNRSGEFDWYTVSGDFFGSTNRHETYLQYNQRHRLIVENDEGDRRVVGSYMALDEANPKVIEITSIVVDPPEGQSYYGTSWMEDVDEDDDGEVDAKTVRFSYTDPDELTDDLHLLIHERGNESNVLADVETDDVGEEWAYAQTIDGNQTEKSWVIDWSGTRDGEEIGQKYPIGYGQEGNLPLPMSPEWLSRFALVSVPIVAALSSERIATLGAMGTVAFAGILMITGIWQLPVVLWFGAAVVAIGGHALTMARRGSIYG